jgi:hypothetical protein
MTRSDREAARVAQEITSRAIRRLDILEWVILGGAAGLALAGGAAVAWLVHEPVGVGFRTVWATASLGLFVVPGVITVSRLRRDERKRTTDVNQGHEEANGRG